MDDLPCHTFAAARTLDGRLGMERVPSRAAFHWAHSCVGRADGETRRGQETGREFGDQELHGVFLEHWTDGWGCPESRESFHLMTAAAPSAACTGPRGSYRPHLSRAERRQACCCRLFCWIHKEAASAADSWAAHKRPRSSSGGHLGVVVAVHGAGEAGEAVADHLDTHCHTALAAFHSGTAGNFDDQAEDRAPGCHRSCD